MLSMLMRHFSCTRAVVVMLLSFTGFIMTGIIILVAMLMRNMFNWLKNIKKPGTGLSKPLDSKWNMNSMVFREKSKLIEYIDRFVDDLSCTKDVYRRHRYRMIDRMFRNDQNFNQLKNKSRIEGVAFEYNHSSNGLLSNGL